MKTHKSFLTWEMRWLRTTLLKFWSNNFGSPSICLPRKSILKNMMLIHLLQNLSYSNLIVPNRTQLRVFILKKRFRQLIFLTRPCLWRRTLKSTVYRELITWSPQLGKRTSLNMKIMDPHKINTLKRGHLEKFTKAHQRKAHIYWLHWRLKTLNFFTLGMTQVLNHMKFQRSALPLLKFNIKDLMSLRESPKHT